MKTINLGGECKASAISLGCMRISGKSIAEVEKLIATALECGINHFDHADIYGAGQSEEIFAKALRLHPEWREKMVIQTKCGIVPGKMFDFSKAHILKSVDSSLKRLGLDSVDALLLHRPDTLMEPDEIGEAFNELEKSGKIKYFGVSNCNPYQIELIKTGVKQRLIANQLQLSAAFSGMIDVGLNVNMKNTAGQNRDGGILEYCRINNITIQAWSPFIYGFFEGIFIDSEKYEPLNKQLEILGEKYGITSSAVALAWIIRHPARIQPIVGTTNPERLKSLAAAADVVLSREEWYSVYMAAGNKLP